MSEGEQGLLGLLKRGSIDFGSDGRVATVLRALVYLFPALILGVGALLSFRSGVSDYAVDAAYYSRTLAVLLLVGVIVLFALLCLVYHLLEKRGRGALAIAVILVVAFALRLCAIVAIPTAQSNDFLAYFTAGSALGQGDVSGARAAIDAFGLNSLAGLAVFNGALCFLTGGSLFGLEIGQAVVECGIVFCIYLIGKTIRPRLGAIAAALYALYPASIVFVTITTNQHLATLFYVLFLLVLVRLVGKEGLGIPAYIGRSCGAGVLLALSYYCHPSTIAITVSLFAWLVFLLIKAPKRVLVALLTCVLVFATYNAALFVGDRALSAAGLSGESTSNGSMLGKFVVGLNHETDGQCCSPYKGYTNEYDLMNHIDASEVDEYCKQTIKERLINTDTPRLLLAKEQVMWHASDNVFLFTEMCSNAYCEQQGLTAGTDNAFALRLINCLAKTDYWMSCLVYLLMAAGCVLCALPLFERRRGCDFLSHAKRILLFPTIVLDAWMVVFFFIEIQPRYRYEMMPVVFVLASIGLLVLFGALSRVRRGHPKS